MADIDRNEIRIIPGTRRIKEGVPRQEKLFAVVGQRKSRRGDMTIDEHLAVWVSNKYEQYIEYNNSTYKLKNQVDLAVRGYK